MLPGKRRQAIHWVLRRLVDDEAGYVLMWVIFSFVIMSTIATAALLSAGTERQSAKAVADWGTSLYLAEAGLQEIMGTVTDSALDELAPGDSIEFGPRAVTQGGTYTGVLHRVDDDRGQRMYSIQVEGRRGSLLSGVQHLSMFATRAGPAPGAAVAVDGNLSIEGNPVIKGTCGGLSVDGRLTVTGDLTIDGEVAAREIVMTGTIQDSLGNQLARRHRENPPSPADVPAEAAAEECDPGSTVMEAGSVNTWDCMTTGTCTEEQKIAYETSLQAGNTTSLQTGNTTSIKYDPMSGEYALDAAGAPEGSVCLDGGVTIHGDLGTENDPQPITVVTEGSVEFTGNPFIEATDLDGALIQADGDLKLAGSSTLDNPNYTGDIYAGGECVISGSPAVDGQIVCGGDELETVYENRIEGDLSIRYDCPVAGVSADGPLIPLSRRAWRQIY